MLLADIHTVKYKNNMQNGIRVQIIDQDFVKANNENIGVITDSYWAILPSVYGIVKIYLYKVYLMSSDRYVLFPIESLSKFE